MRFHKCHQHADMLRTGYGGKRVGIAIALEALEAKLALLPVLD